jgi:hypothetical protein
VGCFVPQLLDFLCVYALAGPSGIVVSPIVDLFNTTTRSWSTARLSVGRWSLAAASVGNLALFAGGLISGAFLVEGWGLGVVAAFALNSFSR